MGVFRMPSLGADMEAGKLVEWLVRPGDLVRRGDIVAVVETQKGAIDIELFETGVIERLEVQPGQTVPVGAPLALIRGAQEPQPPLPEIPPGPSEVPVAPPPEIPVAPVLELPPAPPELPPAAPAEIPPSSTPPSSPAARARAREAGLPLAGLRGSGPGGAVVLADVERALATRSRPGLDMGEMRKAIAAAMVHSKREIPHYYLSHQIDLQAATDWLAATNAARPPETRLLMGALFLRATILAVTAVPEMNGRHEGGAFTPSAAVYAGLIVALRGGGLVAPAIRDAETLSLDALMAAMNDLVARARTGRLRNSELTTGTLTVSSMGETGAEALFGVIYPPQVALVGFGAPRRMPWVVGDAVVPRSVVTATLAADHRVSDGRRGAYFLTRIETLLKEPATL